MTDIQMMNNLDVDGKIKASGDVEDGEGTTMASLKAGKIGDVKIDGQSVVTLGIAEIPPAEEEVVGAAMCGFDGYIESPYWRHATSTVEYVGLYVPYEYTHELVTSENKDSLGIVPGTTKAYNRAGGLFAEITVDQMVEYDSENPVSSKAVKTALLNYVTVGTTQTITGAKTFSSNILIASTAERGINITRTGVTGWARMRWDRIFADNNVLTGQLVNIIDNNGSQFKIIANNRTGQDAGAELRITQDSSGNYATAPSRTYASANVNDVVTIGSLASNPNVLHSTGNETKTGNLTVNGAFTTNNNLNVRKAQPRISMADTATDISAGTITTGDRGFFALYDNRGSIIGDLIISIDSSGKASIRVRARNADGTTRQAVLI